MSLRINTNPTALNAHRNLVQNSQVQAKNLERLSSGLKISRGADGPAALQVSERLRSQASGLEQAIENSEAGVTMIQTAEAALDEVSRALIKARQLTVHAANEAVNDPFMLRADQQELSNILETVNRIARNTQYGMKNLLDGSMGGNGVASGEHLEFVSGGSQAESSGAAGYAVTIDRAASRAQVVGAKPLSQSLIDGGVQINIMEGGKAVNFTAVKGENVEYNLNALKNAIEQAGLDVELIRPEASSTDGKLAQPILLRHKEYGSEHQFTVSSSVAGVLSAKAGSAQVVDNGADVKGEINGQEATGDGQVLTGAAGSEVAGLQVQFSADKISGAKFFAGTVTFSQNSPTFQIGGNPDQTSRLSLRSTRADDLGRSVTNESGFSSLGEVSVLDAGKATDSMRVIDKALEEVNSFRGEIGAFQANTLESNLNYLRIAKENVIGSESVVRDADMAEEMMQFTRNQIMVDSSTAMLAQANQQPRTVLGLIG